MVRVHKPGECVPGDGVVNLPAHARDAHLHFDDLDGVLDHKVADLEHARVALAELEENVGVGRHSPVRLAKKHAAVVAELPHTLDTAANAVLEALEDNVHHGAGHALHVRHLMHVLFAVRVGVLLGRDVCHNRYVTLAIGSGEDLKGLLDAVLVADAAFFVHACE